MSDNLKVSNECGLTDEFGDVYVESGQNISKRKELEAYTSRILASQQAAHEEEIAKLKEDIEKRKHLSDVVNKANMGMVELVEQYKERIAYLEGLVALQADALKWIGKQDSSIHFLKMRETALDAVVASAETVQAFRDKLTEPLRREVAYLAVMVDKAAKHVRPTCGGLYEELIEAYRLSQSKSLAYEQEVEARGAVNALKKFRSDYRLEKIYPSEFLNEAIERAEAELRATSKKAG